MTVAALIDLGVPLELLREGLGALKVRGLELRTERAVRHAIAGTRFVVSAPPAEAPHDPSRHTIGPAVTASAVFHGHGAHEHRAWREIRALLEGARLPGRSGALAVAIFAKLAEAEGAVHDVAPEAVAFHEVGAWDSIADIVCTALAVDHLAPTEIYCGPVPLGQGHVQTAHGRMPIPGPATLHLLRGFPVEQGPPAFERTTPTGAAILAALARPAPVPLRYVPERVGIGIGTLDSPAVPNLLRAVWGRAADDAPGTEQLECAEANLDDANPEWLGYLLERLLAAGALDVALLPVHMKKNRPGTLIQVLYAPALREAVQGLLFSEATTLGVRHYAVARTALPREAVTVATPWGQVQGKVATFRGRRRFSPEFESCRALALRAGVPLRDVYQAAERVWAEQA
ncbi:MAG: nickel pincer cofactor biosynthesis protein LarC [Candidatus Lambdaproteobacteria bacterium]|nr:nickel pincer cofactor biosynthesis protein LarC [Candidatus Lambdaproteobacteria bacterium]